MKMLTRFVRKTRAWRAMAWILACALALPAAAGSLPRAGDLAREAQTMRREATPMAILYSQHGCAWCDIARSQIAPLLRSADAGAIFRQIDIDSATPMTGFDGVRTTHAAFARAEQARFTPMLVLYGPSGERLAEPVVGVGAVDFYAEYVSRAIAEARSRLQAQNR
jgi:thioredoxin-related protein